MSAPAATGWGCGALPFSLAFAHATNPGDTDSSTTMTITAQGDIVRRHAIRLPMKHFKSGLNQVALEVVLMTDADNRCAPDKQSEIDSATSLGNISTIAFIAGGVGLGVGLVGLLTSGGDRKEAAVPRSKSAFTPEQMRAVLGPSYVGVAGAF